MNRKSHFFPTLTLPLRHGRVAVFGGVSSFQEVRETVLAGRSLHVIGCSPCIVPRQGHTDMVPGVEQQQCGTKTGCLLLLSNLCRLFCDADTFFG